MKALESFHPAVREWFLRQFTAPTEPQAQSWPAIKEGKHTLIASPTGSGKTLAAFLSAIDDLVWKATSGALADETHVVYVSPLKALSNDIQINLQQPLQGIKNILEAKGASRVEIRTFVRTGDTPAKDRAAMTKKPPHIIVTTPESLYILLTSEGGRRMLSTVRTLIVDEIHAMVDDKRGSHLALSIERLEALVARGSAGVPPASSGTTQREAGETPAYPLVRIGLSATQKPIEEVARFLVGTANLDPDGTPRCTIIDSGHTRRLDLALEVPSSPLESLMSNEVWEEIYERIANLIREHQTTLVFVNTRRLAERVAHHAGARDLAEGADVRQAGRAIAGLEHDRVLGVLLQPRDDLPRFLERNGARILGRLRPERRPPPARAGRRPLRLRGDPAAAESRGRDARPSRFG